MCRRIGLLAVVAVVAVSGSSCPPRESTPDNPNPLEPRSWSQAFGDRENSGFNAVHSNYALPPFKKWSAPVGVLTNSRPIVSPDGKIFVGNVAGELVALNPDGTEYRRRKLDESILSSPAVNTQSGEIFVVGQRSLDDKRFESRLYHLDAGFGLHNISHDSFSTSAAPKLWRDFVFVPSGYDLLVFDQATLGLVGRVFADSCLNLVCGVSPILDWLAENNFVACLVIEHPTSINGVANCVPGGDKPSPPLPWETSVAIVDSPTLVGDANRPIIVVVTNRCATAMRFYPDGDSPSVGSFGGDPHFEVLWGYALVEVDCDFDTVRSSSPAAVLGGQVIIGDEHARVLSLDLLTGRKNWERKLEKAYFVDSTPAASLRQIYVPTQGGLFVLDSDGDVLSKSPLRGFGGGVALSLDFAYVTTREGVHTFELDPTEGFAFDGSIGTDTPIGDSLPSLGEDGTLYVSTADGFVHAYAPQGSLGRQLFFAGLTWQTPVDGATISPAPGQVLQAGVGAGFEGTVSFVSDMDGELCEVTTTGPSAACTTTVPLSLGTRTLTAFATDVSGGTQSAQITVHAVNTPPTVTITAPSEGQKFFDQQTIAFAATVSDPEELNFPADRVRWKSNLADDLGTGLTIARTLPAGNHTITVTATDTQQSTGQALIHVQIVANTPPTIIIDSPKATDVFNNQDSITFTATVNDPDEPGFPPAHVRWSSSLDGELGTGLTVQHKLSVGDHTITATATDSQGVMARATVDLHVFPD